MSLNKDNLRIIKAKSQTKEKPMSQIFAMLIASAGLAVGAAGPECSKSCPMTAGEKTACCSTDTKSDSCCAGDKAMAHNVAMTKVDASMYTNAAWPAHNTDLYANDLQGESLPTPLGGETWLTEKVDTQGKVVVLDFWATWCPPCRAASPILDQLQKDNPENLAVLAISGQREEQKVVEEYVEDHKVSYAHLFDQDQAVYKDFESRGIPLVVVMSTDGVIRWMGNPHEESFVPAVNKVISADPMIKQRSAAANSTENPEG